MNSLFLMIILTIVGYSILIIAMRIKNIDKKPKLKYSLCGLSILSFGASLFYYFTSL